MHSKRSFQRKLYEVRWPEGRDLIPPLPAAHRALEPGVIALMPFSLGQVVKRRGALVLGILENLFLQLRTE
jgi:hypothetical protein